MLTSDSCTGPAKLSAFLLKCQNKRDFSLNTELMSSINNYVDQRFRENTCNQKAVA